MPLRITGAPSSSSRIDKSSRRPAPSPFSSAKRRKPTQSPAKKPKPAKEEDDLFDLPLEDEGLIASLADDLNFSDVAQQIRWISEHQFSAVPKAGGMKSTRIAEVLNFRATLPPLVSVHHVHAMSRFPTTTEREIGTLANAGIIRRVVLPARESGGASVGEALVLTDQWERLIRSYSDISDETKDKYVSLLRSPTATVNFHQHEVAALSKCGFLIESGRAQARADMYLRPSISSLGTLQAVSIAGAAHASGSAGAVADGFREHISGGSGGSRRISSATIAKIGAERPYNLTLPNIGAYLKLLTEARAHLLSLLTKNSRYREAPRDMLKERWDGGIAGNDEATRMQRIRGEFSGVLPGRTKKWKQFYGLEFNWVLEECLGAGMVECFRTGSVGMGVRAL